MAYDKVKLFEKAKEEIVKNNLFFVSDIWPWLGCSRSTFYDFYPDGSDELDTLKELLDQNKIRLKTQIRSKLFKGDKAAELLALYRLICTPEEHRLLNQNYTDITSKGEKVEQTQIQLTKEQIDKAIENL